MLPLAAWPLAQRAAIIGVFTDIDDTLTTEGAITGDALRALADLRAAGLHVVPITGRPAGWSQPFADRWPVDAIVAENGAVALLPGTSARLYQQDSETRAVNFARMQAVAARVLREVPGSALAQDAAGRETDIAFDHAENHRMDSAQIERVLDIVRAEGMNASVSSIHINAWFGAHDKLAGARWIVRQLWNRDLATEQKRWLYVGDSANDQVMFSYFENTVGVANIRRFEALLTQPPRYITAGERGAGFAETARALLKAWPAGR